MLRSLLGLFNCFFCFGVVIIIVVIMCLFLLGWRGARRISLLGEIVRAVCGITNRQN